MFQYPLFRIVDCFHELSSYHAESGNVSISALSDRGLLPRFDNPCCHKKSVSISALSDRGLLRDGNAAIDRHRAVSISALSDRGLLLIRCQVIPDGSIHVSISALSDRGLLRCGQSVR